MRHVAFWLLLALVTVSACSDSGDPTLRLTYTGDGCEYDGPTEFTRGPYSFEFVNESNGTATGSIAKLDEGYTAQDLYDYGAPYPSSLHAPSWARTVTGPWKETAGGETHRWEGRLGSGTYAVVCVFIEPLRVRWGTGLEVTS